MYALICLLACYLRMSRSHTHTHTVPLLTHVYKHRMRCHAEYHICQNLALLLQLHRIIRIHTHTYVLKPMRLDV